MQHYFRELPGWAAFSDLYIKAVHDAPQQATFVEVGSWLGRSAAFMAVEIINSGKDIDFTCIDPWTDGGNDLRDTGYYKNLTEPVFDIFKRNIAPVADRVKTLQMDSVEGAKRFADYSVDFLMLDGDHGLEAVRADLAAWLPKMKAGGMISGDDYLWPGVKQAVHEEFGGDPRRIKTVLKSVKPNYRNSSSYWYVQL